MSIISAASQETLQAYERCNSHARKMGYDFTNQETLKGLEKDQKFFKLNEEFLVLCSKEGLIRFSGEIAGKRGVNLVGSSCSRPENPVFGRKKGIWERLKFW